MTIKNVLRDVTPPILWKAASRLRASARPAAEQWKSGVEQPAGYYDWSFEQKGKWRTHYTESSFYPLWTIVADRVRRAGAKSVLDIGCGPGQVANLLWDKGVPRYLGLDFSPVRVQQARAVCPTYRFEVVDVFETALLNDWEYDCVLIMEFLEHIERDLEILQRIKPGTRVIATVPNFPATAHVRYFETTENVRARYSSMFASLDIDAYLANAQGKRHFVFEGTTTPAS